MSIWATFHVQGAFSTEYRPHYEDDEPPLDGTTIAILMPHESECDRKQDAMVTIEVNQYNLASVEMLIEKLSQAVGHSLAMMAKKSQ